MPLTGLTWKRFCEHLKKNSPIYLIGIVAMALLGNILFTTTRPQTPDDQEVLIYLVDGYAQSELLDDLCAEALVYGQQNDETLLEVRSESITYTEDDYYSPMVLMARMAIGDGDVYIANDSVIEYLAAEGICTPLDSYVEEGWLSELNLESWYYTETDEDTGEETTYLAALKLNNIPQLQENGIVASENMYLVIASNGSNPETSMDVISYMLKQIAEGNYAPAATEEPAA